mmetsp:Transcript_39801/g.89813  ORF Transcript_39801/g.89813 Transcript_39801/m.89813 type:complete len:204 (+) Transcript_39801:546-1157(+)
MWILMAPSATVSCAATNWLKTASVPSLCMTMFRTAGRMSAESALLSFGAATKDWKRFMASATTSGSLKQYLAKEFTRVLLSFFLLSSSLSAVSQPTLPKAGATSLAAKSMKAEDVSAGRPCRTSLSRPPRTALSSDHTLSLDSPRKPSRTCTSCIGSMAPALLRAKLSARRPILSSAGRAWAALARRESMLGGYSTRTGTCCP